MDQIVMFSTAWCPDCKRAKKFLGEQRVPYFNVDIEDSPQAMAAVEKINHGKRVVPTIVFPDGSTLSDPSNAQLADKLGLQSRARHAFYDVIIIGGGPAGLTAAQYLAREGIETLVIEQAALGGQAGASPLIDNFPGFDQGIAGVELADRLGRQARRFGAEILQTQPVRDISRDDPYLCITTVDGSRYTAKAALLATGARSRKLGVPGEDELIGTSIHFCAICDGPYYRGKKVLVVGGGNSGFEQALFLARYARQVDIVEFQPQMRASQALQSKVDEVPTLSVTTNHEILEFQGRRRLDAVILRDRATGERKVWHPDGVFVFIGLTPNSQIVADRVEMDCYGFVVTTASLMTSMPGLFAAGDVRAGSTRQAAIAAGEGAIAAIRIREYLAHKS